MTINVFIHYSSPRYSLDLSVLHRQHRRPRQGKVLPRLIPCTRRVVWPPSILPIGAMHRQKEEEDVDAEEAEEAEEER